MNDDRENRRIPSPDESSDEWDTVVKRISERMRTPGETSVPDLAARPSEGASPSASAHDVTADLTRLERRALEAEATLATEREAYVVRVQEMQDKLRKIEPWIRKLKGEYETACKERDGLRSKLKRVKSPTASTGAEVQALQTELQAARVAKEAARAELSAMRRQLENDRTSLQDAWQARIATAEKARDQAIEELGVARRGVADARGHEEQVKRLRKEVESHENASAAHKAVARAAQEQQEKLQARVAELEKSVAEGEARVRAGSTDAKEQDQQVRELEKKLHRVIQSLEEARTASENFQLRIAEVDAAARDANIERDEAVRSLQAKDLELDSTRNKLAGLQQGVTALKARVSQAELAAEQAAANGGRVEDLEQELDDVRGELRVASDRAESLGRELSDARALCEAAMASEAELRGRIEELQTTTEEHSGRLEQQERELADERQRAERAEQDLATAQRDLETARGTLSAIETENRTLNESLAAARSHASESLETNERTWRSEVEALEQRMSAEVERHSALAERADDRAAALAMRLQAASEARGVELTRLRQEIPALVRIALDQVVSGFEATLGVAEETALRQMTAPSDLSASDSHSVDTTEGEDNGSLSSFGGLPDWEQVLSDVEALSQEVQGLSPGDYDTADVEQQTETGPATATPKLDFEGLDLEQGPVPSRVEMSEIEDALEAVQEHDDGDHAQPDTCTIDPSDVSQVVPLEQLAPVAQGPAAGLDEEGDGPDDDSSDTPAEAGEDDGAGEPAPRRRRRRRK